MRLTERVYLVGSGRMGFMLTDPYDCHVYAVDGGSEIALVDCGAGMGLPEVRDRIAANGLNPNRVTTLLLTHKHGDHAGGAARWQRLFGGRVVASPHTAEALEHGDEEAISLVAARQAGMYPADYRLEACPVDRRVVEGDRVQVGDLTFTVYETPGHCAGHLSFVVDESGGTSLFVGDAVFFGGRIVLQNIPDCSLQAHMASIRKLAQLRVDRFFPGHLSFLLKDGGLPFRQALSRMDRLEVPGTLS